jgi:hypothetical protein
MVLRAAPFPVADVWKSTFHYLDFKGQARCARVCRVWNLILHELQYDYGRCQALRLGWIGPVNLAVNETVRFSVQGWRGHYFLFSPNVPGQAGLWFRDLRSQESLEVRQDPQTSLTNLFAARWISQERFVTVLDKPSKNFFQVIVWEVSKGKELYQISQIAQERFEKSGTISYVVPLENRIFINIEEGAINFHPPLYDGKRSQWVITLEESGIITKRGVNPLLHTQTMFFSNRRHKIFALNDVQNIKAYDLTDEKTPKLAWEIEHVFSHISPMKVEANDRWFITRNIKTLVNDASGHESVLRVVDSSTGHDVILIRLDKPFIDLQPFWLDGDCLLMLKRNVLQIIHIPTKMHLTSIFVCNSYPLHVGDRSSIHRAYFDHGTLRIVYEDDKGLQVHAVQLEKHQPLWAKPNKWKVVKNLFYSLIYFPRRLWQWIKTLLRG